MKHLLIPAFILWMLPCLAQQRTISKSRLQDKIKGGWAGQTIGVTFGGPYEFRFNGSFIQDYQPLQWYDGYLEKTMTETPGLYDDLYMDLSFVEVIERLGPDAPVDSFANVFAKAEYPLWHANQAARYNILNGISAPQSGYWTNNPHADDIDFQIESDFAGLMCPGMPQAAAKLDDKIGHIMNYGDGWYGGVYISTMYTLAFFDNAPMTIIQKALKSIPEKTKFHECISDVIRWYSQYPNDWHSTWFELQKNWSQDRACPDGVFDAFDIDATINSAYVTMALLYGKGDYSRTLEIATRAGQDADCNPSSAGGILGTMLGYEKIPAYWKQGLKEAETIDFKYTGMSLSKVYETSFRHALQTIGQNGGAIDKDSITIRLQQVTPVRFEQGFDNMRPVIKQAFARQDLKTDYFEFEGTGFVLRGGVKGQDASLQVTIDDGLPETIRLPVSFTTRRNELCWKLNLPGGKHKVVLKVLDKAGDAQVNAIDYIVFDRPVH